MHFFHRENNKTHSCYPINLNGQTRKILGEQLLMFKPVQHKKICVFNSEAITSWGYHESFLPVSLSSPLHILNQKGRKLCTENARHTCIIKLLHPHAPPQRLPPSINTANVLDFGLKTNKFKFQLCYYIHFWTNSLEKGMNPIYFPKLLVPTYVLLQGWLWY